MASWFSAVSPRGGGAGLARIGSALVVALGLAASPSAAQAHDYWFESEGDGYRFMRGHRHSEHDGDRVVPYDPEIVTQAYCVRGDGTTRADGPGSEYPMRVAGPCAIVYVHADSGYWSQTLTGTTNESPESRFGVLRSWHALESAKLLNEWGEAMGRPVSDHLEIVSETDPFALEVGRKLRVRVMRAGKPLEGVTVAYDGNPRGVTGRDGGINIRIRHGGEQRITASVEEPLEDAEVDKLVRSTALFFELPGKE